MKVFDLSCAQGHGFEGWFASGDDFDSQHERGLIGCPLCSSTDISKLPSSPRLNLGSENSSARRESRDLGASATFEAFAMHAMRELMASTEDVGDRFVDDARKIHYGETEQRRIRGQATSSQAAALNEEGIAVRLLSFPPALKETLQ